MSLDVFQQVFSLSLISGLVSDRKGTQTSLQEALQDGLTDSLPAVGAEWQLVWGPVVWKHITPDDPTTGPDNSWYVAYHPSLEFEDGSVHPTYVIAIAGTPDGSEYAWETEDLAVDTVTDFNAWVRQGIQTLPVVVPAQDVAPGVPYIATGTVGAVYVLLTTATPEAATSPGTTLIDFLTNLDGSALPRFITTGHSLGGALSPSLALSLVSAGVIPADSTMTYPSAGPSPGNTTFADLFVETFPSRQSEGALSYQGWNLNLVNTIDVVPQAWCTLPEISEQQNLFNIPTIYGEPPIHIVSLITKYAASHVAKSGVQYAPLASQYYTGSLPSTTPSSLNEFLETAVTEHIQAYCDEVGVEPPALPDSGVGKMPEVEKRFNYPVIARLEWAREHPEEAKKKLEEEGDAGEA